MRKPIATLLALVLCLGCAVPAMAANYTFGSGPDSGTTFGKPSGYDEPVTGDPLASNTRRNKDNSALPPPYFYGSGDIPTDPSSMYHDNTPAYAGNGYSGGTASGGSSAVNLPDASGFLPTTSMTTIQNTAPKYYSDSSIGTLYVARTGKTIKVYEGEGLSNLAIGAGHFPSTSAWDGNVALCGHNRGGSAYFSFVKDLEPGDRLTYTTLYGTRTYEVYSKTQIGEYDRTGLGRSADNILTLITCIANVPELRYQAVAREVN